MATIPLHVFRAYDIRGIVGSAITPDLCRLVGKGFGTELRERYAKDHPLIIVGRDARTHSQMLEQALTEGLVSSGCIVQTIGQTPSPLNYFALCHGGRDPRGCATQPADGSVQVTASHNPKEDNGLKLQMRNAEAFAGEDLQKLQKRIEEERFLDGKGSVEPLDAITPYLETMKKISDGAVRALRCSAPTERHGVAPVVADFGNGATGPVYGEALRQAGYDLISLYEKPDGTFPNHPADPSKRETLTDLIKKVREEKAACGIAFDGDGDRVGFVDETGAVISPDYILLLLAEDYLKRHPHSPVIYTVSMSGILKTEVKRLGGIPVMCAVGHSFVEHAMHEHGAHLGGEQSGHFFCGEDFYDYDDALVAALRVLEILRKKLKSEKKLRKLKKSSLASSASFNSLASSPPETPTFSNLFTSFPRVYQSPELRPHCPDEKKTEIVQKITDHFIRAGYPCVTMDGVRIDFGNGAWAGIRQSNTAPRLSICMEARSPEALVQMEHVVLEHLSSYPEIERDK